MFFSLFLKINKIFKKKDTDSSSVGLGWALRFYTSAWLIGNAHAAGPSSDEGI